jgi:hypothetical protein
VSDEQITDEERMERARFAMAAEALLPNRGVYWLSFAGESGWLGGCMVEADGPISAAREAHRLGINPGGEVAMMGPVSAERIDMSLANRLLTREDLEALGDELMPWPEEES